MKKSIILKFYVIATLYKLKRLKFWTKKIFNKKQTFWQKFVLANLCKFDFQRLSYCTWLITYYNLIYFK